MTWETPFALQAAPVFRFPAALGFISQPHGEFALKIDDKTVVGFDVTLHDETWRSGDGKVQMNYSVMENNSEDSNGVLTITLDPSLISPGKPVKFEVVGSAANSQRWFGLYRTEGLSQVAGSR